jgi:hypothetical protein
MRPPETPPPDPEVQKQEAQLARQAWQVSGQLRLLVERMADLHWQPDGYDHTKLRHVADSIYGMALRCAMSSGDMGVLNEVSGRVDLTYRTTVNLLLADPEDDDMPTDEPLANPEGEDHDDQR